MNKVKISFLKIKEIILKMSKFHQGFTLIEITIVLLIIGILAGIVLINIGNQSVQARDAKRVSDLRNLSTYLVQYLSKQGHFPEQYDSSDNNNQIWPNLNNSFFSAGILVQLPQPPAFINKYEYFPCFDSGILSSTTINRFILRTKLEQKYNEAPRFYEGTYNSSTIPNGWNCSSSVNCSVLSNFYCLIQ